MSRVSRLLRPFRSEPIAWASWLLLIRVLNLGRHALLAYVLGAHDLRVGRGSTFRGIRHVRFGRSFHAHGAVWIEAVRFYGDQTFSPIITIGDHVSASDDLHISCISQITIGNGVLFGSRVYVSDHNHGRYTGDDQSSPEERPSKRALGGGGPVVIGDNVWIGHNVCIIGPAVIGRGAIIGANSVVRGDVDAGTIVAGSPARPLRVHDLASKSWPRVP